MSQVQCPTNLRQIVHASNGPQWTTLWVDNMSQVQCYGPFVVGQDVVGSGDNLSRGQYVGKPSECLKGLTNPKIELTIPS